METPKIKQAIILSAGLGTRMRPLTDTMPKVMAPLLGKPLLEWHIERFGKHGVTEFFINLHYLPDVIRKYFGDGSKWGVKIAYAFESEPLGTAGGMKHFEAALDESFFVVYGDIFSLVDYTKMADVFGVLENPTAMQRVAPTECRPDADLAELDGRGKITRIHPKPHENAIENPYALRGIMIFKKEALACIPDNVYYEIGKNLLLDLIARGKNVYGYECDEFSKGIDTIEKIKEVEQYLNQKTGSRPATFPEANHSERQKPNGISMESSAVREGGGGWRSRNPLVSILIPAYNAEKYIKEALDSALAQTYANTEIVVVDDGSTDRTAEIVQSYNDPRIRRIKQENRGIVRVRNRLLQEARGEYLAYLDADDIYLPKKIEEEVRYLETHPEDAAVYCDIRYFYDGAPDVLYRHRYTFWSGDIFEKLLDHMFITNTAIMMRRSAVDKAGLYDESLGVAEDWAYFLKMARAGMRFGFIERPLVRFRLRSDNNTRFENQPKIQESAVKIFENIAGGLSPEERGRYRMGERLKKRKIRLALACAAAGKKKEAALAWPSFLFRLALFLVPPSLLRVLLEALWNVKKRNLFIRADH